MNTILYPPICQENDFCREGGPEEGSSSFGDKNWIVLGVS